MHQHAASVKFEATCSNWKFTPQAFDLDKILELDHQLAGIPGLRYKVDRNHNLVYLELDQSTFTLREICAIFRKLALDPRFIGAIPAELRPKTKTQPLSLKT